MLKRSWFNQILKSFFFVFFATVGYVGYIIWVSLPVENKVLHDSNVMAKVEIVRDEYGIPSITGKHSDDVFYAQGYVHAQDRMFQMVMMKHMFLGRMSEIFGEKTIKADRYMRYLNTEHCVQASYLKLTPDTQRMLEAYARGVNQYISEHRPTIEQRLLSFKIEEWRAVDSLVIQKAMAFDLSRDWPLIMKNSALSAQYGNGVLDEVYPYESIVEPSVLNSDLIEEKLPYERHIQHFPDGPRVPEGVVDSFRAFAELSHAVLAGISSDDSAEAGSNIWAVGDTDLGNPYVVSDPHLSYRIPNMFYLVHLEAEGLNLTGGSIPGAPAIIIGRNADIAWGFTNGKMAQSDIFYAKEIKGKKRRLETIKVAKGDDIVETYYDSDYGVIISEEGTEYDVAMNWTSMGSDDVTLDAVYGFCRSSSMDEVREKTHLFKNPSQNFVIADHDGNYALFALGSVPIRHHSGRIAVPATDAYRWKKLIPSKLMPRVINPERGYVMNANNDIVSRHYGYNATRLDFDNLRAVRLVKMLQGKEKYTARDMAEIQLDNEDQKWILMKDAIMTAKPESELAKRALAALEDWDGQAVKSSYEITIFSIWMHEISTMLYQDITTGLPKWAKPQYSDLFVRNSIQRNGRACLIHISCDDLLTQSLEKTVERLHKQYKTDDITMWTWDQSHLALFRHPVFKKIPLLRNLSTRKVVINGARDTLNRSRWYSNRKGFKAIEGACLRMIANTTQSTGDFSVPMGQSENMFSKHYDDLLPIWAEGQYITLERNSEVGNTITIMPK